MIRYVYCFHENVADGYLKPDISDVAADQARDSLLFDAVRNAAQFVKTGLQNCSFWFMGTFDTKNGTFDIHPVEVVKQDELVAAIRKGLGEVGQAVNEDA